MQDQVRTMKVAEVNARVVKGILRTCIMLRCALPESCCYVMDVLSWIVRCDVHLKCPKLVKGLYRVWDDALSNSFLTSKDSDQSLHGFFRRTKDIIHVVYAPDLVTSFEALLKHTGKDFLPQAVDLYHACESLLGKACWSWARPKCATQVVDRAIANHIDVPPGNGKYGQDWITSFVDECMHEISETGADKASAYEKFNVGFTNIRSVIARLLF